MEENLVAPTPDVVKQAQEAREHFRQTTLERQARLGQWVENHHSTLKGILMHLAQAEGDNHPIGKAWNEMPSTKYLEDVVMVAGASGAV